MVAEAVGLAGGMVVTVTVAESLLAVAVLGVPALGLGVPFAPTMVLPLGAAEPATGVACGVPLASTGEASAASHAPRAAARRRTPRWEFTRL